MKYRIEYDDKYCDYAENNEELIEKLKSQKLGTVTDIRKIYRSGVSDSVLEKYQKYIH